MSEEARSSALKLIEVEKEQLRTIGRRWIGIDALERELVRRVGDETFLIANEFIWCVMLDHRAALIVHFASWAKGVVQSGGFFGKLCSNSPNVFWVKRPRRDSDCVHHDQRRQFEVRFPAAAARGKVQPEDVKRVKDELWKVLEPVVDDRDNVRAHPYEKKQTANARMLSVPELGNSIVAAQNLMNDLRLFLDNSTYLYKADLPNRSSQTPEDLVDLLLFGSIDALIKNTGANQCLTQMTHTSWSQYRKDFVRRLKELHAERADPTLHMNDPKLVRAAMQDLQVSMPARSS